MATQQNDKSWRSSNGASLGFETRHWAVANKMAGLEDHGEYLADNIFWVLTNFTSNCPQERTPYVA